MVFGSKEDFKICFRDQPTFNNRFGQTVQRTNVVIVISFSLRLIQKKSSIIQFHSFASHRNLTIAMYTEKF